jgi:hypothetical protein
MTNGKPLAFFMLQKKARFIIIIMHVIIDHISFVSHPQFHRPKLRCVMLSYRLSKVFHHLTAFFYCEVGLRLQHLIC